MTIQMEKITVESIAEEQKKIRQQINIEESVDYRVDHKYVRELWDEWHRLEKIRKFLVDNDNQKVYPL